MIGSRDLAKELGVSVRTLNYLCKSEGFGQHIGRGITLTDEEADKIRRIRKDNEGRKGFKKTGRKS